MACLRDPEAVEPGAYRQALPELLTQPQHRDLLVAWLSAMSVHGFSERVAVPFAEALRGDQPLWRLPAAVRAVNVVGTGGGRSTFNISTTACFVAAAAGARVLKTGSPSFHSLAGSTDVLRALGVYFDAGRDDLGECLDRFGLAFVPTSAYPATLRRMAATLLPLSLKEIGGLVNRIGPLLAPYAVHAQLTGVPRADWLQPYARALASTGTTHGWVVHAEAGVDELASLCMNRMVDVREPDRVMALDPEQLNCRGGTLAELAGAAPDEAAQTVERVLQGRGAPAQEDTVALNAAVVLSLGDAHAALSQCFARCRRVLAEGAGYELLLSLREHGARQRNRWRQPSAHVH